MARTNTNNGGGGSGVSSLNSLTGALNITAGDAIGVTPSGSDVEIDFLGVSTDGVTIIGDGVNQPIQAINNQTGKGLLTGGAIWSGTGFVFDIGSLTYYIDGVTYGPTTQTQVTLGASDPTNPRFDVIVVDDAGVVSVVAGTPGTPPNVPEIGVNQVEVSTVLVEAASTTPTINYDLMYNEDAGSPTEWVASTYSLTGAVGTINNASTNNPFNGTKCIEATGVNIRRGSLLTRGTDINIQNYTSIQFAFRISTVTTTQAFNIRFRNSGGSFIGNTVNIFNWGASRTALGVNQVVVVPITAFGNIGNVRSFVGIMAGGSIATTYNWALDFIKLSDSILPQGNLGPIYLSPSNTLYSSGAATGATTNSNSIFFGNGSGFIASNADNSIFQGNNSGYAATSADNSVFLGNLSGYGATNANNSNFQGHWAGYLAIYADNSQFQGTRAGYGASSAYSSIFLGTDSGKNALNAYQSSFIGREAGQNATNASDSSFFGYQSGNGATNASNSFFMGAQSGNGATSAAQSVFLGFNSGNSAALAANSIFIGNNAGLADTVDNTLGGTSIVIGYQSNTGGFSNSIMLGTLGANTAANQFMIGSALSPINEVVVSGTGGIQVPVGTTAQRSASQGMIRYNTTTSKFEGYDGSTWSNLN